MRIATYLQGRHPRVGLVSADGSTVSPFRLTPQQEQQGALSVITLLAEGGAMPRTMEAEPLRREQLQAPLPRPRRNLLCVGRNYHAHAKELSASVFKNNDANPESWPIVFTKMPESVVGPNDDV